MPTEEKLTVNVNRKVQLEQFEPIQFGATLEVSLDDGDDVEEVYEAKSNELAEYVDKEITRRVVDKRTMAEYAEAAENDE